MLNIKKKIMMAATTTALGAMLIGAGTFAMFTSSAANSGNTVTAGTVEVGLDKQDGAQNFSHYFEITNMAPGDTEYRYITVSNTGSLDLKFLPKYETDNGLPLTVKFYPDMSNANAQTGELTNWSYLNSSDTSDASLENDSINVGTSKQIVVRVDLPIGTTDAYQGANANVNVIVDAQQYRNNK